MRSLDQFDYYTVKVAQQQHQSVHTISRFGHRDGTGDITNVLLTTRTFAGNGRVSGENCIQLRIGEAFGRRLLPVVARDDEREIEPFHHPSFSVQAVPKRNELKR